jgi:AraC-like DNA-binding protein
MKNRSTSAFPRRHRNERPREHRWQIRRARIARSIRGCPVYDSSVTKAELANLARLRRARDYVDRFYDQPLDVAAMAREALMSPAHFARQFRSAYGESPYGYLMTRRVERAMALLRAGARVTDACVGVGATSLGSFSARFHSLVGETPSQYRARAHHVESALPPCLDRIASRPRHRPAFAQSRNEEARRVVIS